MSIPHDIIAYANSLFAQDRREQALQLLRRAVLHDGKPADARCLRSALVGSGGDLDKLRYYIDLLRIDFRDVIVAGEYENRGGTLVRVRNLNAPIAPHKSDA